MASDGCRLSKFRNKVVPLRGEPTIKTGGFLCMVWRGIYLVYVFSNLFRLL